MSTTTHTPKSSTAVVGLLALAAVGAFLREVTVVFVPAVAGIVGVLLLTGSLRIVGTGTEPVDRLIASLLSIPIAGGFVVGVFGTTLVLTATFFPVEDTADVSLASLLVVGNLGIVIGCTLAVFGVTLGANNVIARDALTEYTTTAIVTAVIPLLVGFVLVVPGALSENGPAGVDLVAGDLIGQSWRALVSPGGPQLHLVSFLITVGVTGSLVWLFVRRAPLETLLADTDERTSRRVTVAGTVPHTVTAVTAILLPVAILVEFAFSPIELREILGPAIYDLVRAITTAGWLRLLLLGTATVAGGWVAGSALLETVTSDESTASPEWVGPLAVGVSFTVLASTVAESLFEWIVDEIASRLPPELAAELLNRSARIEVVYGETPIIVLLTGLFVGLAAVIGLWFRLAVRVGYLADDGTGFSIACSGLFLAAISAATISAPAWLVLGGIVAAVAVWDIGHFGTELGREVAGGASSHLITVRTGATLLIAGTGVAVAVGLQRFLVRGGPGPSSSTTLALLSFVTALVAFAIALR